MRTLSLIFASLWIVACAPNPPKGEQAWHPVPPVEHEPRAYQGGSIYQDAYAMRLYEDGRARRIGDILTVTLEETTTATKKQDTTTSRSTAVDVNNATLWGRPATDGNIPFLDNSLSSENSFAGAGASSQSNQLSGTITVSVTQVFPNGLMAIRGEKWLQINQGQEYVRVSGLVRELDIGPDNTVSSTRIANAHIAYAGKGSLADSNQPGWLSRFFNSVVWPF